MRVAANLTCPLLTIHSCRDFLSDLIPRMFGSSGGDSASSLSSLQVEDVHGLMQDRTSSHLFEVSRLFDSLDVSLSSLPLLTVKMISLILGPNALHLRDLLHVGKLQLRAARYCKLENKKEIFLSKCR